MFTVFIIILLAVVGLGMWSLVDEKRLNRGQVNNNGHHKSHHKKKNGNKPDLVVGDIESPFYTAIYSKKNLIVVRGASHLLSDIVSCEVEKNTPGDNKNYEISTNTGNMAKRAIVGGVLAGGIGAVVGASTASKSVKETTPLPTEPTYTIRLIKQNLSVITIYNVEQRDALKIKTYFEQRTNRAFAK